MIAALKGSCIEWKEITKDSPALLERALGMKKVTVKRFRFLSPTGRRTKWYKILEDDRLVYDASDLIGAPLTLSDLEGLPRKRI